MTPDPMEKAKKLCEENGWNLDIVPMIAQALNEAREEGAEGRNNTNADRWCGCSVELGKAKERIKELETELHRHTHGEAAPITVVQQRGEISKLSQLLDEAVEVIEAKDELLVSYRLGTRPKESTFNKLEKNKDFLTKAKKVML
jgi:hypothetical protein